MDKFDLVYKKYKDLPIDRTIFMSLIVTVLREKKMHTLDSNISEDIIFMNEMDKEITIYLKNQIEYYNDIDSEIYLIEKYKYVFLLPKINETSPPYLFFNNFINPDASYIFFWFGEFIKSPVIKNFNW